MERHRRHTALVLRYAAFEKGLPVSVVHRENLVRADVVRGENRTVRVQADPAAK